MASPLKRLLRSNLAPEDIDKALAEITTDGPRGAIIIGSTLVEDALRTVLERFGLSAPEAGAGAATLIGLGTGWRISPFAIARAYSELIARSTDPGVRELLAGMALSARSGTGRGVGAGAYVKTGTAPCMHQSREAGDGYVIALYPMDAPRFNLLVRVHGVPGAKAAWTCGKIRRV